MATTTIWCIADETLVSDPAGVTRLNTADRDGNLLTVVEDPGSWYGGSLSGTFNYITSYTYDPLNNLTAVSQGGSRPRSFIYDTLKRLTQAMNPESGTIRYSYDDSGNLATRTDANSITTTYSAYDGLNRVTGKSYSGGPVSTPAVSYCYDNLPGSGGTCQTTPATGFKGRLTYVANANSSTLFGSFDAMGRVLNSTQTTNGITYPQFSYGYCGHRASAIIVPRSARSSIPRYL